MAKVLHHRTVGVRTFSRAREFCREQMLAVGLSSNTTLGLLLVVLICLASAGRQFQKAIVAPWIDFPIPGPFHGDFVRAQERFGPLRAILPRGGLVGYISDSAPARGEIDREVFVVRYTLAPLIVMEGTRYPYVIGNFHRLDPDLQTGQKQGLRLVKNLGNGVILFRSDAQ